MKQIATIIIAFIFGNFVLSAQTDESTKDFNFLVNKIKADYPGYKDKVKPENASRLLSLEKELRDKLKSHPDSCIYYLRQYASYFKDNHLRVGKVRIEQKLPEKSDISSFGKNIEVDLNELKKQTGKSKKLEGVWTSRRGDIAVIKSSESNHYRAVDINYQGWNSSQAMFEFIPQNDSVFDLKSHSNYKNSQPRNGTASLHLDGNILEIHNDSYFARKSNSVRYDKAILATYIPEFPNGRNTFFVSTCLSDSTFYIRIPSFSGFKDKIEQTISKQWFNIMSRPNLIIDIRNNAGGQDDEFQILSKLIYTNPYISKGVEWYATSANIKLFEYALKKGEIRNGEDGILWTKALVSEMKKNVGGFVVHPFNSKNNEADVRTDTVYLNPKRVGIIINEGNASSAEQFLLGAKNSKKVVLFGNQATAGVLDYSNAVSVDFPSGKYQLTFPMTRSMRLPENPIDNIGIKPDMIIPFPVTEQLFDKLDSWVYFVKNYLELNGL